ncbi:MAG TPA: flagellar motor protein MotB [Oligoflexus sp.]|uniref:OmpA/MotB family protein n=1 Tax=Oligoflexus sp. TaxID=1971216 RepID=UPI002D3C66E9|nr:flagellar motor protein MotB [Oligoflexus sp.]HYX36297.1 flagellar motor protein MotB [Oligoflexus sp.]
MRAPIRRKRHGASELWQTAYIDLMTNIMIFFVIFWSLSQAQSKGISETVGDVSTRMVNLPGDVLFRPGQTQLSPEGRSVFAKLFQDDAESTLNFKTNGLVKRVLFIHGHTDAQGQKDKNFVLGFERAMTTYKQIAQYGKDVPDHVVICSHADNLPIHEVPKIEGSVSSFQKAAMDQANAKNRRIQIEDRLINQFKEEP